jgi:hypothetical protein
MSKHLRTLAVGAAIVAGLAAAPLYAQDYLAMPHGSMKGEGMMGQGGMMGGMMGSMMSGMMNMMGMSGGMGGMMEHCNTMMPGTDGQRPNDQWRSPQPEQPSQPQG